MNIIYVDRTSGLKGTLEKLREEYPTGSQVIMTENNFMNVSKKVSFPPIFTEGWLILAYCRKVPYDVLADIGKAKNVVIYIVRSEDDALELALELDLRHIVYRYLNDSIPSKEEMKEYIIMKLNTTPFMADYLGNRANWRFEIIESSILALSDLKKITKKDINYFTPLHPNASMDDVIEYILGFVDVKQTSSIYSVVQRYSYSYKFLYEITLQKLDMFLWLYENIEQGLLNLRNMKDFRKVKIKEIRSFGKYSGINTYRLERLINAFSYISKEKIYYLNALCRKSYEVTPSVLGYLHFMKVGESGENSVNNRIVENA